MHFFQDRETIRSTWKAPSLASPMRISLYMFKYFLGVPARTLAVYRADTSGPSRRPYLGSNISADKRIDYLSHQEFLRASPGPGSASMFRCFQWALNTKVDYLGRPHVRTDVSDFRIPFQEIIGTPLIKAIFGSGILRLNPNFVADLFEFGANAPCLARGVPSFIIPSAHRAQRRLGDQLRKWQNHAKQHVTEFAIHEDGGGDPLWGKVFIRNRHAIFSRVGGHDRHPCGVVSQVVFWVRMRQA